MNENQTPHRIICFIVVAVVLSVIMAMHADASTIVWSPCGTGIEHALRVVPHDPWDDPVFGQPVLSFQVYSYEYNDFNIDLYWWMRK